MSHVAAIGIALGICLVAGCANSKPADDATAMKPQPQSVPTSAPSPAPAPVPAAAQQTAQPSTPAPAATSDIITHDAATQQIAISSLMGIADIFASTPAGPHDKMELSIVLVKPDGTRDERSITMRLAGQGPTPPADIRAHSGFVADASPDAPARNWFAARVKTDTPRFEYYFSSPNLETRELHKSALFEARLAPTPHTPDWAKGAVWYQIFPERFRNGNPLNDPKGSAVFLADWNANWYEVQPGEMEAWKARRGMKPDAAVPKRPGGELYHVIFDRRYGGDLQGIVEKMDELKDLGITALYLNPIFEAESLHKYDASDFRHIDERLGKPADAGPSRVQDGTYTPPPQLRGEHKGEAQTEDPKTWDWTPADRYFVDVFLPEAKKRGLRVILDGVWNHTGTQFWAFQDIVKNGRKSPYADWYICEFDEEGKLKSWTGWPGRKNGSLPEFRQVKGGLTRDRDETVERGDLNQGVKEHIFAVTRRWMDPNGDGDPSDGIDGWRLDVAGEVGEQFWRDWRRLVKGINPEAIMIAEIWSKVEGLGGASGFDTQMNYPFAYPILNWLTNQTPRPNWSTPPEPYDSFQMSAALKAAFQDTPQTNLIHQNLFASHDTPRYVNMLANPGRQYDRDAEIHNGHGEPRPNDPNYIPFVEEQPARDIYKLSILGVALQATYIGSPMIYYGDEWGMWGADDPNDRKPVPWEDKGANKNATDVLMPEVREQYRYWLRLRQDPIVGETLRYGAIEHLESGNADVFAFARHLNNQRVLVIVNRSSEPYDAGVFLKYFMRDCMVPPMSARVWND
jgi:glycosidase